MFVAVDTNFLLGLAWDDEDALDGLDTIRSRAPHLIISATETVLQELGFFRKQRADKALQAALVTEDSMLRGVDYARLVFEIGEFGLHPPVIATTREIVSKFFP